MLNAMSPYILLGFLIAGIIYSFIPRATMSRHLSGTGWKPVVKAAAFGIPLPLCSCGVLPTAIGLRRSGASRAASSSFLIATPQTGVDSIAATWSLLGPHFALIRPVAALVTAVLGGLAIGRQEKHDVTAAHSGQGVCASGGCDAPAQGGAEGSDTRSIARKCIDALRYGYVDLVGSIGGWLVAGLVIAALITVYVPDGFFSALGGRPLLSMLAVLTVAVPMYICATGSIPIALSLMLKGLSPGTAFVMLMAGPAANFASFALIRREMGLKTALTYLASICIGAICTGLIIDCLLPAAWFNVSAMHAHAGGHAAAIGAFDTVCSAVLAGLLTAGIIRNRRHTHKHISENNMKRNYTVRGMSCAHCQATVTKAILAVKGVTDVCVNLSDGIAEVAGDASAEDIRAAVRAAGFDIED